MRAHSFLKIRAERKSSLLGNKAVYEKNHLMIFVRRATRERQPPPTSQRLEESVFQRTLNVCIINMIIINIIIIILLLLSCTTNRSNAQALCHSEKL